MAEGARTVQVAPAAVSAAQAAYLAIAGCLDH